MPLVWFVVASGETFPQNVPQCAVPSAARFLPATSLEAAEEGVFIAQQLKKHTFPDTPTCRWAGRTLGIAFVHVGKTGGGTLGSMLWKTNLTFNQVHEDDSCMNESMRARWPQQVPFNVADLTRCELTLYIVMTRDPVNRTISAFNFQGSRPPNAFRYCGAQDKLFYTCFPTYPGAAQAFAESLDQPLTECGALARAFVNEPAAVGPSHIGKGVAYYTRDVGLLEVLRRPDKSAWLVRTEHFDEDVAGLWEWLCVPEGERPEAVSTHTSYDRKNDTQLSAAAEATLRAHLTHEYYAKDVVEGLADNPPSQQLASLASPPTQQEGSAEYECSRACGTLAVVDDDEDASTGADGSPVLPVIILVLCCLCACWPVVRGRVVGFVGGEAAGKEAEMIEAQGYDSRPNEAALAAAHCEQAQKPAAG